MQQVKERRVGSSGSSGSLGSSLAAYLPICLSACTSMVTRAQFVVEARKWMDTPFQHQGRLRGLGVDCVGLVLCVMRDLGLNTWVDDFKVYSSQPVGREVLDACLQRLRVKGVAERLPGDVLCFRVPVAPVHIGIVTEVGIIHAYNGAKRRVTEHGLSTKWMHRIEGCFSIPGVG